MFSLDLTRSNLTYKIVLSCFPYEKCGMTPHVEFFDDQSTKHTKSLMLAFLMNSSIGIDIIINYLLMILQPNIDEVHCRSKYKG